MGYDLDTWKQRHIERIDLTTELVHLTRPLNGDHNDLEVLYQILKDAKLIGSTTESGFIIGSTSAVCFQDAPLHAVGQNCWFEQKWREGKTSAKIRYVPTGIIFEKTYVFSKGGRPVIYDKTDEAKDYLPSDQWWRIVSFNLDDLGNIIDWSHEREWRVPVELGFSVSEAVLLFANNEDVQSFINLCDTRGEKFYKQARGIATMQSIVS